MRHKLTFEAKVRFFSHCQLINQISSSKPHFLKRVKGTGSTDPQEMLIFWELLIFRIINVGLKFLVTRKRLTYHVAITDGIACRPLNYGVWNACET